MSMKFPNVPLSRVLTPIERPEAPQPGITYRLFGVKWWGEGVYEREAVDGSQTQYAKLSRIEANDIVINKIWARHGSVAVVQEYLAGCYGGSEFPTFLPDPTQLEPRWIHWLSKTASFWAWCAEKSYGTSGKNRIRPEQFLAVEIPLPSLDEQRRIVAHIEALAARIAESRGLRQQAVEEAEAIVSSAKRAIFNFESIAKWNPRLLGDIADIVSGVTLGRQLTGLTIRLPYLRVANVQDGHLDLSEIKEIDIREPELEKWQLEIGDILLTEGGDWDKLGRGTVWQGEIQNCIHQNHIFRVRVDTTKFDPRFLMSLISSPYGKSYFQSASKQTTNLASINQRQLKAFTIFQPPMAEQRHIVAYLDDLHARVNTLKRLQVETAMELDALLPAVLDQAFRGELSLERQPL